MKKAGIVAVVVVIILSTVLGILAQNPFVSCEIDIPETYLEAIKNQSKGVYSHKLPLVPVFVSVDSFYFDKAYYTIYYFPLGTVGMSYDEDDGYNIEKPLTYL